MTGRPCQPKIIHPTKTADSCYYMTQNYGSGGYPENCGGTQYSASAISSITTQMNTQWPSFTGSNSA